MYVHIVLALWEKILVTANRIVETKTKIQKQISMDVPSSRKYIHPTRWVHAKNCKQNSEYNVPKTI